jgi:FAD/FMN-containing dehydrogenase
MTATIPVSAVLAEEHIQEFKERLHGPLLRRGDEGYDAARTVWNGMIDRYPALIARCTGTADVVAAVNFARTHEIPVSVRGGGHQVAGTAVNDGGLVIDLSRMKGIHVNPDHRTVRAQAGATWGDLDWETQVFGLATPGGEVSATGIAGLTLGGGIGLLRRKYGLSCDNLLSVQIVTADGHVRTASETDHPDLFWAARGGGRGLGVVTSFEYQLHPVGPEVMTATVMYPFESAEEVLHSWCAFAEQAPDEVTSELLLWSIPADPAMPDELHEQAMVIVIGLYAGPVEHGEQALQPLRELSHPVVDLSGPAPYLAVQSSFDAFFPDGLRYYWKSVNLDQLDDAAIRTAVALAAKRPTPQTLLIVRHLGGAISRVPDEATAYANRAAAFNLSIDATWEHPADDERVIAWTRDSWAKMQRFSNGGVYLNFAGFGEEGESLVRAAHGGNYERLVAVKKRYDPTNIFRTG